MKILKLILILSVTLLLLTNLFCYFKCNPILIGTLKYQTIDGDFTTMEIYGKGNKKYKQIRHEFDLWKSQSDRQKEIILYRTFERDWTKPWRYIEYLFHPRWKHPLLK